MRTGKRIISFVLAFVLGVSIVCTESIQAHAASNIMINGVDIGYANGDFFTKDGKICGKCHGMGICAAATSASCNCMRYWPTGKPSTCEVNLMGTQCLAYARYCQWRVYGSFAADGETEWYTDITGKLSASACTESKLKSMLLGCAPATHVRMPVPHSLSIISTSDSNVTFTDCNADFSSCRIRLLTYTWEEFAKYVRSQGGIQYTYARNISPSFGSSKCTCTENKAGTYICTSSSTGLIVRSGHGTNYSVVGSIPSGAYVYVSKTGSNGWAHVQYNDISGYASLSYLKFVDQEVPLITQQPETVYAMQGELAKTTVKAKGSGLTYEWYIKSAAGTAFSKSSITKSTYSAVMDNTRKDRAVYCVVTDQYGNSVQTDTVYLRMAATITGQSVQNRATEGERVQVSLTAVGDGLTYAWYYKNPGGSKFYKTSSFTGPTYAVAMNDARDGRQIYCVITDQYGNEAVSDVITLEKARSLSISVQPKDVYVQAGKTAKVSLEAQGDGLTYQWYIKSAAGTAFSKSSITKSTYSAVMDNARKDRAVYCVVTDQYGNSVQTDTVYLHMAATVTVQPKNVAVEKGKKAEVSVKAVGDGLTYTWYYKNAGGSKFYKTSSFTGPTYAVTMSGERNGRQIYCVVADQYGNSVKTDTVTLSMD